MIVEVRSFIEQLLSAGTIRKSKSLFALNVVLVKKKDGTIRMRVDYRMLNKRTIKDLYALPRIEDNLDKLSGSNFSILNMESGYHQVEIEESHKHTKAFTVGPIGFYEFNRLQFGISNSPAMYQRILEECLKNLKMNISVFYLDDLIILADSYEEHLEHLYLIFNRLWECDLKLHAKKCKLFQEQVKYAGFIVSADKISTDPDKVQKVLD